MQHITDAANGQGQMVMLSLRLLRIADLLSKMLCSLISTKSCERTIRGLYA